MINLIDKTEVELSYDAEGKTRGICIPKDINKICYEKLELGLKQGELIYTQDLRNIGKTYELIQFAKHRDLTVVEPFNRAKMLKDLYKYEKIYSEKDNILMGQKVLVDEGVNISKLTKDYYCEILTGYIHDKKLILNNNQKELTFTEKAIKTLKEEARILDNARDKSLNNGNFSDYKLLIDNYKKVINLIQELEEEKNPINYTMNITMSDVKNTDEFVKALKDLSFQAKKSIY
jgi:hypothetical protein